MAIDEVNPICDDMMQRECSECEMLREEIDLLRNQKAELFLCITSLRAKLRMVAPPTATNPLGYNC